MAVATTFAPAGGKITCPECYDNLIDTGKRKINYRGVVAALTIPPIAILMVWMLAPIINPPKLEQIKFEQNLTRVKEADAVAQISIFVTEANNEKLIIEYSLFSGTATAGEDFNNQSGQLIGSAETVETGRSGRDSARLGFARSCTARLG